MAEMTHGAGDFPKAYTPRQLEYAVRSNEKIIWGPSLATPDDLKPKQLDPQHYDTIVDAMLQPAIMDRQAWPEAPIEVPVPDLGTLTKVGHGERRICYKFMRTDGLSMAVVLGDYDHTLRWQVPQDPRFTHVAATAEYGRERWLFSELYTYLALPVGKEQAVIFQEFGGVSAFAVLPGVVYGVAQRLARMRALRTIGREKNNIRPDYTRADLRKPDHLLYKPGRLLPVAHNIDVVEAPKPPKYLVLKGI